MPSVEIIQHAGLDQFFYDNKLQRFNRHRIFEISLLKSIVLRGEILGIFCSRVCHFRRFGISNFQSWEAARPVAGLSILNSDAVLYI